VHVPVTAADARLRRVLAGVETDHGDRAEGGGPLADPPGEPLRRHDRRESGREHADGVTAPPIAAVQPVEDPVETIRSGAGREMPHHPSAPIIPNG